MTAMEATAGANLPDGFRYDWTASSYEERKSGNAAPLALGLSLVFTFLFLAALYESFLTPLAIILAVPLAVIGALIALLVGGEPLSLYGQIGLVMLVGLSAKTAILIVEYSKALRERDGLELGEAATKAARLRFRAVLMTSLSFVAGVFPLVIASGAGAASRVSLGLAVFGGTIMASIIGTIFVPVFFRAVQGFRERVHGGKTSFPDHAA
jgi:HAE1 family hydrophobic/amphiphilic exporter-1